MIGIEKIKEYLGAYKSNYVVIGGTACNLNLEEANLVQYTMQDVLFQ
jgi:hypothetical protein